jgi:phenylacetic acid degradation operon negative regulatory protein
VNDPRLRSIGTPAARSTLLTILGEYVLPSHGSYWQETLVRALTTMGYTTSASRQALARSTRAGWLESERQGRRTRVSLSEESKLLLERGAERIYDFGEPWQWDGRWLVVVLRVPEVRRELRHQLRTQLAWAGFGSSGGGIWLTPHVEREIELKTLLADEPEAEAFSFYGELGAIGETARLVAQAWDLRSIASQYETFLEEFRAARPVSPESCFRSTTAMVHAWRKFPFIDPDLPADLLPPNWARPRAAELFRSRREQWREEARGFFESLEGRSGAPS